MSAHARTSLAGAAGLARWSSSAAPSVLRGHCETSNNSVFINTTHCMGETNVGWVCVRARVACVCARFLARVPRESRAALPLEGAAACASRCGAARAAQECSEFVISTAGTTASASWQSSTPPPQTTTAHTLPPNARTAFEIHRRARATTHKNSFSRSTHTYTRDNSRAPIEPVIRRHLHTAPSSRSSLAISSLCASDNASTALPHTLTSHTRNA